MSRIYTIHDSIENFCTSFSKREGSFGELVYSSKEIPVLFPETIIISDDLKTFYSHVRMLDEPALDGSMAFQIIEVNQLESALDGWRYIFENGSKNIIENPSWNKYWTIFAVKDDNSLFVDTVNNGFQVFGGMTGSSDTFLISDSLSSFFQAITLCLHLEDELFPNDSWFDDEDCSIKPIVYETYLSEIKNKTPEVSLEGFRRFFFG